MDRRVELLSDWYVVPQGTPANLSLIRTLLDGVTSASLEQVGDEWQLRSERWARVDDPTTAWEIGRQLVSELADAAGALSTSFVQVRAGGLGRTMPDGTSGKWVFPTPAVARLRVFPPTVSIGGEPQESRGAKLIRLQSANPDVRQAMHYLNADESWYDHYKAFETIRMAVGNSQSIAEAGWAPSGDIERFRRTAQIYRHAAGVHRPPDKPMSSADADGFVRALFWRWVDSLA